jgi:hypothetical protein
VDLDEGEAFATVHPGGRPASPNEKLQVFAQVDAEAGTLVALDIESVEAHPGDDVVGGLARQPKPEDDHRPAGGNDRFGLAPDTRILLVVAVDDHQDGASPAWATTRDRSVTADLARLRAAVLARLGAQLPVDHPAPRRRTWRDLVACPWDESTVSMTRFASR